MHTQMACNILSAHFATLYLSIDMRDAPRRHDRSRARGHCHCRRARRPAAQQRNLHFLRYFLANARIRFLRTGIRAGTRTRSPLIPAHRADRRVHAGRARRAARHVHVRAALRRRLSAHARRVRARAAAARRRRLRQVGSGARGGARVRRASARV